MPVSFTDTSWLQWAQSTHLNTSPDNFRILPISLFIKERISCCMKHGTIRWIVFDVYRYLKNKKSMVASTSSQLFNSLAPGSRLNISLIALSWMDIGDVSRGKLCLVVFMKALRPQLWIQTVLCSIPTWHNSLQITRTWVLMWPLEPSRL